MCLKINNFRIASFTSALLSNHLAMTRLVGAYCIRPQCENDRKQGVCNTPLHQPRHCEERNNPEIIDFQTHNLLLYIMSNIY